MQQLHADEIAVDTELVRSLIADQCPHFREFPVVPVASAGTDNWLFRLGTDMVVRLPRRPSAGLQIAKQHEWLPRLAPSLPLRIPTPCVLGTSSATFPCCWSVYSWIEGEQVGLESIASSRYAAGQLGRFVNALQSQSARDGPLPGPHNSFRGEPLVARDQGVRLSLDGFGDDFSRTRVLAAWEEALDVPPHDGPPRWIHGDLLQSNLLEADDQLVAVIDFGLLGAGDPACDFMAGWTLFDSDARACFRAAAAAEQEAWLRGRGWALAFAAVAYPYYRAAGHPLAVVAARTMNEVLSSHAAGER